MRFKLILTVNSSIHPSLISNVFHHLSNPPRPSPPPLSPIPSSLLPLTLSKMGAMVSVAHVDSAAHVAACEGVKATLDATHAVVARMTSDLSAAATSAADSVASSAAKRHKAASGIVEQR